MMSRNWLSRRIHQVLEQHGAKSSAGLWRPAWQSNPAAERPISWWRAL
ncbi:hypothetical protein H7J51_25310 [Mycobacterium crocinum]|uniref:Uncharacterized protein n=1 Tax=Mycolicibacterium crocinum TaxID=388459 RepID=A0ABY3TRG9_9MYCO|nr:hypothetical protein [Mycolicibacterium crocinum]MCV7218582.1 hypothetical protein [Mycolicibacterium crocinum]ULN43918.1 hypothetical protein MI149_13135 [Mycolicibacterium crocinum]